MATNTSTSLGLYFQSPRHAYVIPILSITRSQGLGTLVLILEATKFDVRQVDRDLIDALLLFDSSKTDEEIINELAHILTPKLPVGLNGNEGGQIQRNSKIKDAVLEMVKKEYKCMINRVRKLREYLDGDSIYRDYVIGAHLELGVEVAEKTISTGRGLGAKRTVFGLITTVGKLVDRLIEVSLEDLVYYCEALAQYGLARKSTLTRNAIQLALSRRSNMLDIDKIFNEIVLRAGTGTRVFNWSSVVVLRTRNFDKSFFVEARRLLHAPTDNLVEANGYIIGKSAIFDLVFEDIDVEDLVVIGQKELTNAQMGDPKLRAMIDRKLNQAMIYGITAGGLSRGGALASIILGRTTTTQTTTAMTTAHSRETVSEEEIEMEIENNATKEAKQTTTQHTKRMVNEQVPTKEKTEESTTQEEDLTPEF